MNGEPKITAAHLARRAVVYLRQSSEGQVRHNVEYRSSSWGQPSPASGATHGPDSPGCSASLSET